MKLRQTERKQAKIKMAVQGVAGSGKTYSSLLLAYGMTNDWSKIAVIDTENGSADLYAHLGCYNVLTLSAPFNPEKYIEAIGVCENAGMEVVIIDSISHSWDYLLEFHAGLQGNSFTNWGKITPRQNAFIQRILQSTSHVICTMRTKQDYILTEKNGKMVPEKVGLKAVMRDGIDYEFTIVFDIDIKHNTTTSKDRTGLFMGKPDFIISHDTGKVILDWCNSGASLDNVRNQLNQTRTIEEQQLIFNKYPEWREELTPDYMQKKYSFEVIQNQQPINNYQPNFIQYGNNAINSGTANQN